MAPQPQASSRLCTEGTGSPMSKWKIAIGPALLVVLAGSLADTEQWIQPSVDCDLKSSVDYDLKRLRSGDSTVRHKQRPTLGYLESLLLQFGYLFTMPLPRAQLNRMSSRIRSEWNRAGAECRQLGH